MVVGGGANWEHGVGRNGAERPRTGRPQIAFESGRYLVGTCGRLVCTAAETRAVRGNRYVLLDSGINHLGGLAGLGRMLPTVELEQATDQAASNLEPAQLVGPLCTPGDTLGRAVPVDPATVPGLVVIPNVGAYGLTASLIGFLSRPTSTEVVVDGSGGDFFGDLAGLVPQVAEGHRGVAPVVPARPVQLRFRACVGRDPGHRIGPVRTGDQPADHAVAG